MWQLNLRHHFAAWHVALAMKDIQGIDDEARNEIFDILEEHVSCLTWQSRLDAIPGRAINSAS